MAEDQQNRTGINLEELEKQLRIASRAHAEAVDRSQSLGGFGSPTPAVPDLEALRREYAQVAQSQNGAQNYAPPPIPDPSPPPAFLSAPSYPGSAQDFGNPYDERFPLIDRQRHRGSPAFLTMIGIVALLILGSFGYFFYSGKLSLNVSVAPDQKAVPVIKADPGPIKIVPETANNTDQAPAGSELFAKKGADTIGSATTKSSLEAPVDVNAAVKNTPAKSNALVPGMGEPKAVRTVTVRPDGTLIGDPATSPMMPTANTTPVIVTPPVAAMAQEPAQLTQPAPAVPATPVQQPSPKVSQSALAAASMAEPASNLPPLPSVPATLNGGPVPMPPVRPSISEDLLPTDDPLRDLVAEAAKPEAGKVETQAQDTVQPTAASPSSGDWSVQFGASPSEAEAKAMVARLKGQLEELLGNHELAVIKADVSGKAMFRVRALGYTRDEAGATCATSAAAGTKCFIARN